MTHPLPSGRRSTDPPPKQPLRWRVGLAVRRHPVVAGCLVALVVLIYPTVLAVRLVQKVHGQQEAIAGLVEGNFVQRKASTEAFCDAINEDRAKVRELVLKGVKDSKRFEETFLQLGLPPYEERLRQAEESIADYNDLPCDQFRDDIERKIREARGQREDAR